MPEKAEPGDRADNPENPLIKSDGEVAEWSKAPDC
jgi:hypothetical protein